MKSVYVGNLPYATTDNELKALFEPFGTVFSARIKTDRETGRPLGYGFVQMDDAAAASAIEALNGKEHSGRTLRVNESRERTPGDRPPRRDFSDRGSSDRPPRREFGDRPPRRDFSDRGPSDRPPRREFGGPRPPRPDDRPRRDFKPAGYTPPADYSESDDFDAGADEQSDYSRPSGDFSGNDRPQRRRTFRKPGHYNRDNQDGERRRPFFKRAPRKKGYRPNEDYDSEE